MKSQIILRSVRSKRKKLEKVNSVSVAAFVSHVEKATKQKNASKYIIRKNMA